MDCREARKKLSRLADNRLETQEEPALREHLSHCPDCARLADAERQLVEDFEQLRTVQPLHPTGMEQVRREIAIRDKRYRNTNVGVRVMQQITEAVHARPRLSLAVATIFVLLVASVLVPVRTESPVGYEVAFAAPCGGFVLNQGNAEQVLAALNIDDAHIESSAADSETVYTISQLKDTAQVRRLVETLGSMGGRHIHGSVKEGKAEDKTIWQLLIRGEQNELESSISGIPGERRSVTLNLNKMFDDDFVLWMPVGVQSADSMRGVLLERKGDKTDMQIVGVPPQDMTNDCGLSQYLNGNTVMKTTTPDGEEVSLDLTDINDVRWLEKAGYNFTLMEFDKPGQVPIPGLGPKLNEIDPNPFTDRAVIQFMIPQAYEVTIQIVDKRGRLVRSLLNCIAIAGIRHVSWDGSDDDGNPVEPGTYQCRFTAGDYAETQEITLRR